MTIYALLNAGAFKMYVDRDIKKAKGWSTAGFNNAKKQQRKKREGRSVMFPYELFPLPVGNAGIVKTQHVAWRFTSFRLRDHRHKAIDCDRGNGGNVARLVLSVNVAFAFFYDGTSSLKSGENF